MKDDIDKIDEQIQTILDTTKEDSQSIKDTTENMVTSELGDTKKLDNFKEVEEIEILAAEDELEKKENPVEETSSLNDKESVEKAVNVNNDPSGKKSIVLIVVLCTIVLTIGIVVVLLLSNKKNKINNNNSELSMAEKEEIIEEYGDAIKEVISINYQKKNISLTYEEALKLVYFKVDVVCDTHELYDDGSLYLDDCMINNEKVSFSYGEKQVKKEPVVPAGNVSIYVLKGSGEATLEKPRDGSNYVTYSIDIKEKYYNLELLNARNSDYVHYVTENDYKSYLVNYKTGEKALKGVSYSSIVPISNGKEFDIRYAAVSKNNNGHEEWGFYDIINNKEIVQPQFMFTYWGCTSGPTTAVYALNDKIAVNTRTWKNETEYDTDSIRYGILNYKNGTFSVPIQYKTMWNVNDYLFCKDLTDNSYVFDYSGKRYLESQYDAILDVLSSDYILVQAKKNVKLIDIDGKILYNYGEYTPKSFYTSYKDEQGIVFIFQIEKPIDELSEDSKKDDPEKIETISEDDYCVKFFYYEDSKTGKVEEGICNNAA